MCWYGSIFSTGFVMDIVRRIVINATPEAVFNAITDFPSYPLWNPWITKAVGSCEEGASVTVDAHLRGKTQQYLHTILSRKPPYEFLWCDKGWFTLFVDGRRLRQCVAVESGTEYTVTLSITGALTFLVKRLFGSSLEEGMTKETHALKQYVEKNLGL